MTTETETVKAPPTVAELEGKVQRLTNQVQIDAKASADADNAFAKAVKSGNVDEALKLADERGKSHAAASKSEGQLKTAQNAVKSAKHALNADKVAAIHDQMHNDAAVNGFMQALEAFGVTQIRIERSEGTGKLLVNSIGPSAPKVKRTSSNGGNRGTASWDVGGQSFTSRELIEAHLDKLTDKVREHYEAGNFRAFSMTREAERIHQLLTG